MLNSKICRQHAAKCIETAEAIPPGAQREMFLCAGVVRLRDAFLTGWTPAAA